VIWKRFNKKETHETVSHHFYFLSPFPQLGATGRAFVPEEMMTVISPALPTGVKTVGGMFQAGFQQGPFLLSEYCTPF
jgi:hypothetical protein